MKGQRINALMPLKWIDRPSSRMIAAVMVIILMQLGVTIINMNNGLDMVGEDYGLNYIFPGFWRHLSTNMWDDLTGTGKISVTSTFTLVWAHLIYFLRDAGLSSWIVERLVFFCFLILTNFSSFFFFRAILGRAVCKRDTKVLIAALAGSWMYTFSVYVMSLIQHPLYSYHFFIGITPLLLLLIDKNIQRELSAVGVVLTSLILLFLMNCNFSQVILILILASAYYFYFLPKNSTKANSIKTRNYILSVFVSVMLLTAHIWMPLLGFFLHGGGNPYGDVGDSLGSLALNSRRGQMSKVLLGTAHPWFDSFDYDFSYSQSIAVMFSGFFLLLYSLVTCLFPRRRKVKIFWLLVILIAMFFAKGLQPPFAGLEEKLFRLFPVFGMFRATFFKFWIFVALGLGVMTTLSTFDIECYFIERKKYFSLKLLGAIFLLCIGINRYPFFVGDVIQKCFWVKFPNEYRQLERFFAKSLGDGKVLALPATPRGAGSVLLWSHGDEFVGPNILAYMNIPYIDSAWFIQREYLGTKFCDWWECIGLEQRIKEVIEASSILAVHWVFVQKDGAHSYIFGASTLLYAINSQEKATMAINYLDKQTGVKKVWDNPYFAIYEIVGERTLPHVHIA